MPAFVRSALKDRGLEKAYRERPPYQRNDYLGWIAQAKTPQTKAKRLDQMLTELGQGHSYMNMPWNGETPKKRVTAKPRTR